MATSKKRPATRKKRVYRAKRKKGARALHGVLIFIAVVVLSILALKYIDTDTKTKKATTRISEEELNLRIKEVDGKLNDVFSDIGIKKYELIRKKVDSKVKDGVRWDFKQVVIKTDDESKLADFKNRFQKLSALDNVNISLEAKQSNRATSLLSIYGLSTHKVEFEYVYKKQIEKKTTDRPVVKKSEKDEKASKPELTEKPTKSTDRYAFLKDMKTKPRIAIIFDDIGQNQKYVDDLLKIPVNINLAILPGLTHSRYAADKANGKGWDVMLHLPMEPKYSSGYSGVDAGENALLTGLTKDEILLLVDKNLGSIPYIKGVNNHMGSKFTESSELMKLVLEKIKKNGLYFIDSKTSPQSVAYAEAKKLGIRAASRDVFLDEGGKGEAFIKSRLDELLKISKKQGYAVGICHPYPQTIKVLSTTLPELTEYVEFIPASQIVN